MHSRGLIGIANDPRRTYSAREYSHAKIQVHLLLAEMEDSDRVGEFRLQFLASRTARFVD